MFRQDARENEDMDSHVWGPTNVIGLGVSVYTNLKTIPSKTLLLFAFRTNLKRGPLENTDSHKLLSEYNKHTVDRRNPAPR